MGNEIGVYTATARPVGVQRDETAINMSDTHARTHTVC